MSQWIELLKKKTWTDILDLYFDQKLELLDKNSNFKTKFERLDFKFWLNWNYD